MAEKLKRKDLSVARELRVRTAIPQVVGLSDELKMQVSQLNEDELAVLKDIKSKLNDGLTDDLAAAADTVGGFVW